MSEDQEKYFVKISVGVDSDYPEILSAWAKDYRNWLKQVLSGTRPDVGDYISIDNPDHGPYWDPDAEEITRTARGTGGQKTYLSFIVHFWDPKLDGARPIQGPLKPLNNFVNQAKHSLKTTYNIRGRSFQVSLNVKALSQTDYFSDITTDSPDITPADKVKIDRITEDENLTTEQKLEKIEEVRKEIRDRLPSRYREGIERKWYDYVKPGESIPLWEKLGLDQYDNPDSELFGKPMPTALWRKGYMPYWNQTAEGIDSRKNYARSSGKAVSQKKYEATEKGRRATRKYAETEGGKARRKESAERNVIRKKLYTGLVAKGFNDYEIHKMFWKQGLYPQIALRFGTEEEHFEQWYRDEKTSGGTRINPASGEEYT